ncbi:hypothetical protein JTB14_034037 [Gonioctena quinquepunctata]|nr:hypothetical protein JTB14_034037 [Gonioctena quinquepunctata]
MSENGYDWLARHLGHDVMVHREFYRLHESEIKLMKISRLLMAVDQGEANRFAGKHIQDIELKELPNQERDEKDKEHFNKGREDTVEDEKIKSFSGTSDTAVETEAGQYTGCVPGKCIGRFRDNNNEKYVIYIGTHVDGIYSAQIFS